MFANLTLGAALITLTVLIHTTGLIILSRWTPRYVRRLQLHRDMVGQTFAITVTVLSLFFLHTLEVWAWAVVYVLIGAVGSFEPALYFSTVMFSTVGYGDVQPVAHWRQFTALEAVDGFLLIGWSIAYLVAASTRHGPFRLGEHF